MSKFLVQVRSPGELGQGTWTTAGCRVTSSVLRPDSRQAIPCALPRRKPELGQELGQGTWTNFITCFPLTEPLVQVRPGNLDKELGQLRAAVLQALSVLRPDSRQAPIPTSWPRAETRTWTRTWTRNLDKFYHVFSSCRATCPSSPGELGQGTWTTAGCRVTSSLSITPRFQAGPDSVCLASLFRGRFPNGFYST